jgi:hypothetical protein
MSWYRVRTGDLDWSGEAADEREAFLKAIAAGKHKWLGAVVQFKQEGKHSTWMATSQLTKEQK